jgi:hypothetical protein
MYYHSLLFQLYGVARFGRTSTRSISSGISSSIRSSSSSNIQPLNKCPAHHPSQTTREEGGHKNDGGGGDSLSVVDLGPGCGVPEPPQLLSAMPMAMTAERGGREQNETAINSNNNGKPVSPSSPLAYPDVHGPWAKCAVRKRSSFLNTRGGERLGYSGGG